MRNLLRFGMATMLAGTLAACQATPEERFVRAQEAFEVGDFAAAKIDLTAALKEKTGNVDGLRLLALTQLELADGEGATNTLDRLKTLGKWTDEDTISKAEAALLMQRPDDVFKLVSNLSTAEAHRVKALAHLMDENGSAAEQAFRNGETAAGPKAKLRAEYARFHLALGELGKARAAIEVAKGEDASLVEVQIADGQIAAAQGQPKAALNAYNKVLQSRPANRAALLGRIAALGDMGRLDEAEEYLDAMAAPASDIDYAFLAANIASQKGDWDEARSILQPLETRLKEKPELEMLYGLALAKTGQSQQARARLAPLVQKFPQSRALRVATAEVEFTANDSRGAFKTLQPVADRIDASRRELELMANIAQSLNDPSAVGYRSRSKLPSGERFASLLTKGDQALRDENWTQAVDAYQAILGLTDGSNAMVLNNLGYALGKTGQAGEGLAFARRALQLEPKSASVMDTVAMLMIESGEDREQAVSLLRKATKIAPDNRRIAARLKAAEQS